MIIKVQMPLVSSDPAVVNENGEAVGALIYDRSRTVQRIVPLTKELIEKMEGSVKRFFKATLVGDQIEIGEPVRWEEW